MPELNYGIVKTLPNATFEDAVQRVTEALQTEGFGVLTEIDAQATLKKKLDVDFRRYAILGACNPPFAHQVLSAERQIGLLLPCNVVVQDAEGGGVEVSVIDPVAMFEIVDNPSIQPIAQEVKTRLERVLAALE